jgi:hypothetical protein
MQPAHFGQKHQCNSLKPKIQNISTMQKEESGHPTTNHAEPPKNKLKSVYKIKKTSVCVCQKDVL